MKEALDKALLLFYQDSEAPTCLMTDASNTAVGAVLQQQINNTCHPISFFSRKSSSAEICYSAFDRELPAVTKQLNTFSFSLKVNHFMS